VTGSMRCCPISLLPHARRPKQRLGPHPRAVQPPPQLRAWSRPTVAGGLETEASSSIIVIDTIRRVLSKGPCAGCFRPAKYHGAVHTDAVAQVLRPYRAGALGVSFPMRLSSLSGSGVEAVRITLRKKKKKKKPMRAESPVQPSNGSAAPWTGLPLSRHQRPTSTRTARGKRSPVSDRRTAITN